MEKPTNLPTIEIDGEDYTPVHERINYLKDTVKEYSINTEYEYMEDRKVWIVTAQLTIHSEKGDRVYTGSATKYEESLKDEMKESALMWAETIAVGRACAWAGIGTKKGIASANEMASATPKKITQKNPSQEHVQKAVEQKKNVDGQEMASVKQKTELLLLCNKLKKEEKEKVILEINGYTSVQADKVIARVKEVIKEREEQVVEA